MGVIPRIVVRAEIGAWVESHVTPSKIVSEIGYVADVPYDLASGSVAKFPPRFFLRYHDAVAEAKRRLIVKALRQSGGNYTHPPQALGGHPHYLNPFIPKLNF